MKKAIFTVLAIMICGVAFAGIKSPYAVGTYEQSSKDVTKCVMYGIMVDGTLYPVQVSASGAVVTVAEE
jgi:hypothetical protein